MRSPRPQVHYKMCQELCDVCKQIKAKMQPKIDAAKALVAETSDEEGAGTE